MIPIPIIITTILPQIGIAGTVAAASAFCILKAKRSAPLTRKEVDILWKLHKKNAHCTRHKWHPRTDKKGELTGFKCECGYRYTQKRPLLSRTPANTSTSDSQAFAHALKL